MAAQAVVRPGDSVLISTEIGFLTPQGRSEGGTWGTGGAVRGPPRAAKLIPALRGAPRRRPFAPLAGRAIVSGYADAPRIAHGFNRASYSPVDGKASMPAADAFHSSEDYHATLLHELVHSSGHPDRPGRFPASGEGRLSDQPTTRERSWSPRWALRFPAPKAASRARPSRTKPLTSPGGSRRSPRTRAPSSLPPAQARRAVDLILGRRPEAQLCAAYRTTFAAATRNLRVVCPNHPHRPFEQGAVGVGRCDDRGTACSVIADFSAETR
jgi:hypothetical protein